MREEFTGCRMNGGCSVDGIGSLLRADVISGMARIFDLRSPAPQYREGIECSSELGPDDLLGRDVVST